MKLSELFPKSHVLAEMEGTNKEEVIREMVRHLCNGNALPKSQAAAIEKALMRREELGSTGIGKGVAVPHAKVNGVSGVIGAFGRSLKGVSFNSLDGQPVYLVFMLISSPDAVQPHLDALHKVTRLLKDDDLCSFLRRAKSQAEIADLLREAEDRLAK